MITTILPNTNPTSYIGASHKEDVVTISREEIENASSFNLCDFQCPYVEPAFSEAGAIVDSYKNDTTPFLQQISLVTDTVVFKLFKCENGLDVDLEIDLDDNTYGIYSPPAPASPLRYGFIVDWNLVFNDIDLGHGTYFIKTERILIGIASELRSWHYTLQLFSEIAAGETVLITANQRGTIEGGIDYEGAEWINILRIYGTFGSPAQTLNKTHYANQGRRDKQVKDSISTTYTLETELMPHEVIAPFIYDSMLANDTSIMSYDNFGFLPKYSFFRVVVDEIEEPTYYPRNTNGKFTFKFSDRVKTPVKTNFN